jgi:endonuclease/exonuclease/phosphatase family metal-dependent hydrolase
VRIATFNLLSGRSLSDGRADAGVLAEAVRALDADVLALQEVDRHQPRSGGADQAGVAAAAMGALEHRFLPLVHGTPGRPGWRSAAGQVVADGDAAYGIALASRLPVRSWHVLHLGRARGRYPIMVPSSPPQVIWIHDEPRAALVAVLERPRITVVATHLSFVPGVNVAQLRRLRRALTQLPGPHVVVGDLNLPGRLPARVTGWRPLVTGPTFPSPAPRLQIDHVLTDDLSAGTERDARIVHLPLSDHRAVTVDLALQDELVP